MPDKKHTLSNIVNQQNPTLFLDRDGVINQRIIDEYVLKTDDFQWIEGVKESIQFLSGIFAHIIVVTNQQGIGKGLMTTEDLDKIHKKMTLEIHQSGGRIDGIYYCADLKERNSFFRKPQPGMGLKAKKDFPSIHFKRSLMVGDTLSDMQFGKNLRMTTVLIHKDIQIARQAPHLVDHRFDSLLHLADYMKHLAEIHKEK